MHNDSSTTVDDQIESVLSEFLLELHDRLCTQEVERVLSGKKDDLTSFDLGQKPEIFTEDYLIRPLLNSLGIEYERQPYVQKGDRASWPDLRVENLEETVIVENKPINNLSEGEKQIKRYIDRISVDSDYGIITDGIEWRVFTVERGGDRAEFPEVAAVDLRDAMHTIAYDTEIIASQRLENVETAEAINEFTDIFAPDSFNELVSVTVPQDLRNLRQRDVEEFYELYIELLFGEGSKYDYNTCLLEDIQAPTGTTEENKRRFAVILMNRLIFIKNLENKGVIADGLLLNQLEAYEQNSDAFLQSFYQAQIKPLFYDLLNQPYEERPPRLRTGWEGEIPYLNGGLFRETLENEKQFTIKQRVLPNVIRDLIEGGGLEIQGNSLDPAILGSVFERTINYIGGKFGTQKDIGAYYTPDDVTQLITEQTVDTKLYDVLVNTWVEHAEIENEESKDEMREYLSTEFDLSDILQKVENGQVIAFRYDGSFIQIDFDDDKIITAAIERLNELSIIDPACGSGHFLTTAMEQMYRVRQGLERGLSDGDTPIPQKDYEIRKQLTLNSIYGVDISPIAIQIARLRVWLKMIEDGWQDDFGRLPNIELNIIEGNSLIGLPVSRTGETRLSQYTDRLDELVELRRKYKQEESTSKNEVLTRHDDIREKLNEEFANQLTYTTETAINSVEKWNRISECIPNGTLYPEIKSIKTQRSDGEYLTSSDKERLEEIGFRTYKKSARVDIETRHEDLRENGMARSHSQARNQIEDEIQSLLNSRFKFTEVKRQPVSTDIEDTPGTPIHWMAEFPEVSNNDDSGSIGFDIVIGNPPYGNILDSSESICTNWYTASDSNEIAVPFVNRQIQLTADNGYFGNITTLRLIVQSSMTDFQQLIKAKMDHIDIAAFGYRPSYIFDNAEIQVSILTGKKSVSAAADIRTSDFIWITDDERNKQLSDIDYASVNDYTLSSHIGSWETDSRQILPKIGSDRVSKIIEQIRQAQKRMDSLGETYSREDTTQYPVWRREGLLYWVNPMLEKIYDAREVKPMYFETEIEQRAAFMILQSNLFYRYWVTYGNQRHLNWGQIKAFPFPGIENIEPHREKVMELSDQLWRGMKEKFDQKMNHFHTDTMKHIVDEFETDVIAELYELERGQIQYLNKYHTDKGRGVYKSDMEKKRSDGV